MSEHLSFGPYFRWSPLSYFPVSLVLVHICHIQAFLLLSCDASGPCFFRDFFFHERHDIWERLFLRLVRWLCDCPSLLPFLTRITFIDLIMLIHLCKQASLELKQFNHTVWSFKYILNSVCQCFTGGFTSVFIKDICLYFSFLLCPHEVLILG